LTYNNVAHVLPVKDALFCAYALVGTLITDLSILNHVNANSEQQMFGVKATHTHTHTCCNWSKYYNMLFAWSA